MFLLHYPSLQQINNTYPLNLSIFQLNLVLTKFLSDGSLISLKNYSITSFITSNPLVLLLFHPTSPPLLNIAWKMMLLGYAAIVVRFRSIKQLKFICAGAVHTVNNIAYQFRTKPSSKFGKKTGCLCLSLLKLWLFINTKSKEIIFLVRMLIL